MSLVASGRNSTCCQGLSLAIQPAAVTQSGPAAAETPLSRFGRGQKSDWRRLWGLSSFIVSAAAIMIQSPRSEAWLPTAFGVGQQNGCLVVYSGSCAAQPGHSGGNQVPDIVHVGHVCPHRRHVPASLGPNFCCGVLQVFNAAGTDRYVRSLLGQSQGGSPANALAAAGYDGYLAVQPQVHG